MGKSRQLSPELWPLIDVILFSYSELIFRGGVSFLPAALLLDIGKQNGSRCDAAKRGVPSGSILFAYTNFIEK